MSRDDHKTFLTAGIVSVFLMIGLITYAYAADAKPAKFECWAIRKAVQSYGEAAVIDWARAKGVSEAEITAAKRCLK